MFILLETFLWKTSYLELNLKKYLRYWRLFLPSFLLLQKCKITGTGSSKAIMLQCFHLDYFYPHQAVEKSSIISTIALLQNSKNSDVLKAQEWKNLCVFLEHCHGLSSTFFLTCFELHLQQNSEIRSLNSNWFTLKLW